MAMLLVKAFKKKKKKKAPIYHESSLGGRSGGRH